ncbi:hypothetical protein E0500_038795 [Streptomyces sp. KM273126]|uniref:hypothetical protein n=1 Tax=Streptomyces sp. KM273126 TaxID=2545247 RepID=UPI001038E6B5|nr:hypothetical protein [Streptomyces sp. KM273126]MBA2813105.1 hypothetical protein [Streptomyces sp. KM273126]
MNRLALRKLMIHQAYGARGCTAPRHWYVADDIPVNAMGTTQKFVLLQGVIDGDLIEPGM